MKKKKKASRKETDTGIERFIEKEREFQAFVWWNSIPAILRRTPTDKLNELGFDTEDPVFMQLLSIKTKTQFSKELEVDQDTLTKWLKTSRYKKELAELIERYNILPFEKDMAFHFTQAAIRESDAPRVKLWYQLFKGWQEKQTVKVISPISELLDEIYRERQPLVKADSASSLGPHYRGGPARKDKG